MNIHGSGNRRAVLEKHAGPTASRVDRPTAGRQRVPTTHPVPEPEDVLRFDPELVDVRLGRAHPRRNARRSRRPPSWSTIQARARWALIIVSAVVNVFDATMNRVCSGSDLTEHIDDVGGIDIGDEMTGDVRVAVGAQCLIRHRRTQVRATNADVDNVRDSLAGGSPMGA